MDLFKGNQGKGEGGFTLIELLVVIAILAVLAAVAIPAYSRFFGAGTQEADLAELSNMQAAMDAMMAHHRLLNVVAVTVDSPVALFHNAPTGCVITIITTPPSTSCATTLDEGIGEDYEFLHPSFLRIGDGVSDPKTPTKKCYYWNDIGFVRQHLTEVPDPITGLCS